MQTGFDFVVVVVNNDGILTVKRAIRVLFTLTVESYSGALCF